MRSTRLCTRINIWPLPLLLPPSSSSHLPFSMAAQEPIPIYTSLDKLYSDLGNAATHAVRWNNLAEAFEKQFGRKPAYIARAPGRVNLIGEHIDYALFGVLPAAIEPDILIACAPQTTAIPSPGHVHAHNLQPQYKARSFAPMRRDSVSEDHVHLKEWDLAINRRELHWESYVKAGYYGVLNRFFPLTEVARSEIAPAPIPVDLLVTGTVPAGSGLSSSAAMVVASTLVFLAVNGKLDGVTKGTLTEMAMENEKRVGVNSGGMDQAASVISTPASALYVSFFPKLSASPIPLPSHAVFILANSLVMSEKAVHARTRYNLRVVETLAGARALAHSLGVHVGPKERVTLREVVGRLGGEPEAGWDESEEGIASLRDALGKALAGAEALKSGRPDEEGLTMDEMVARSGLGAADFHEVYLSWIDVEATYFQLHKRTKHVLSEALRVLDFRAVCQRAAADAAELVHETALKELGALMDASMESCSTLCECSCPELDLLARLAREAGAYGSRVTGAGWGGCTVSLVPEDRVEGFITQLRATYPAYKDIGDEDIKEIVFATKPSSGACVYEFTE
ncbi:hypothetical protein EVG20_g7125 [Dentipellis fragilis]|uniref:Galactokinase n=1 Tax=Dentipellis fragilis TaxID=205917 RepID=A0A4Y9YFW7_9AGAM|nr:hypothetical protein EVG20_g7125 [Dentipellis fragilis]